ncbi:hypothetical protein FPOAC2_03715 [Fusarium poae]|jgi:hypothetical protein
MSANDIFQGLPRDIAAVVSRGKTYIFFVNSNHELCYLLSPNGNTQEYDHHVVQISRGTLRVKCGSRQVAAMAWQGQKDHEVCLSLLVKKLTDLDRFASTASPLKMESARRGVTFRRLPLTGLMDGSWVLSVLTIPRRGSTATPL